MTELKSSAEYEIMLHAAQDKLKKQIEAKRVVAAIDIDISQYTQNIRQITETIQKLRILTLSSQPMLFGQLKKRGANDMQDSR